MSLTVSQFVVRSLALAIATGALAPAIEAQDATPVTIGQPMAGRITTESPLLEGEDGIRYQRFSFRASGRTLRITLRSFELDSYLVVQKVTATGTETVGEDDDGGGDLDSQVILEADGEYIVIARHFGANSTGSFTLLVEDAPPPEVVPRGLSIGQRVEETLRATEPALADGSRGHEYRITLAAGTRLRITVRSTAFDARLAIGVPSRQWLPTTTGPAATMPCSTSSPMRRGCSWYASLPRPRPLAWART